MGVVIVERGRVVLGINVEHPIVTSGDFVALLCDSNALFSYYFGEDCFQFSLYH